ncbi:uncharacterized protein LOC143463210 [Clavelina lepadiformis]|uniref:uncharacterized protein LOC143463210 n=1 Tax=Clavelina lepadiformis TaxID=159417 RepID=UPI0040411D30
MSKKFAVNASYYWKWFTVTLLYSINIMVTNQDAFTYGAPAIDESQHGIDIDLIPNATKCMEKAKWTTQDILPSPPIKTCYPRTRTWHVGIEETIDDLYPRDQIPNSGPHREAWAVFGEYDYLPPGRYVHNLEHGGVVFLYHPCTPDEMVEKLRHVAVTCTWKYNLSKYPKILNITSPMAVVVYGCVYKMSYVKASDIRSWIRHNQHSPEANENAQGPYSYGLIHRSDPPKENGNSGYCPDLPEDNIDMNVSQQLTLEKKVSADNSTGNSSLQNLRPSTPRNKEEARWAVGSLVFLVILLTSAICYTRLWQKGNNGESFAKVANLNDSPHTDETIDIKGILKKLPHVLKKNRKKSRNHSNSKGANYHLLNNDDEESEEDQV